MNASLRGNARRLLRTLQRYAFPLGLLVIALYASRIGAEFILPQAPGTGTLLGVAAGTAGAYLARHTNRIPHLLILLPSTVFPFQSPELAMLCGLLALTSALVRFPLSGGKRLAIGVFAVGLLFFGLTLAPGILPADGGEFQLVIAEWGVAHPPGYPLYTLLGGLFARAVPVSTLAWRVNLFSALLGALTLAVVAWTVHRETGSGWAGLGAAGILGSASAFWTTATQASIRPMTALFMALMIAAALEYRRAVTHHNQRQATRALFAFGLAAGFGVTHHASLIFGGTMLAGAMLALNPRLLLTPRQWSIALTGALAGALPWAYLLARGAVHARLAPPTLTTWDGFWQHVLAAGFAGDMFYYRALTDILERLRLLVEIFTVQWHWSALLLMGAACGLLIWRRRWSVLALGGAFGIHALVTATYRAPQTVEYMLPAYVCLAVLTGLGAGDGWGATPRRRPPLVSGAIIAGMAVAILWSGWPTWISLRAYQRLDQTESQVKAALQAAPPHSTLLANWHQVTPLWVLQAVEHQRPDVTVRYLAPQGSEPILDTWTRAIQQSSDTALITCAYYPESFRHTELTFSASGPCWQVSATGQAHPAPPSPLATFDSVALMDAQVPSTAIMGETLIVDVAWYLPQATPYGTLTTFLHLVDETDTVMAQVDRPFMAGSTPPGLIQQRLTLHLPRTLQPGNYRLMVGLYRPDSDGSHSLFTNEGALRSVIAAVEAHPSPLPPVTAHRMHSPLASDLTLIGYDYDLSIPGRARLYLHWQLQPAESSLPWQITIYSARRGLAEGQLSASRAAGFVTTAYDIPDTAAAQGIEIAITHAGQSLAVRGAWQLAIQPAVYLPPVSSHARYIPVGNAIITGYAWGERNPAAESARLSLTISSTQPQTQDMTLKLVSAGGEVETPPLGGMLPSLKWGWHTTFRSALSLPLPVSPTTVPLSPVTLTLYDAFTSETWPVFDPALRQAGNALLLAP